MIFLTADPHLGHKNLLEFKDVAGRYFRGDLFSSVEQMDETIVRNWNRIVTPQDKVYLLGDVTMGANAKSLEILRTLNGTKVLIRGNHDKCKLKDYVPYFKDVRATHMIGVNGKLCTHIVMSHVPLHPDSMRDTWVNVHGHTHQNGSPKGSYVSVCVELTNYTPVPLNLVVSTCDAILEGQTLGTRVEKGYGKSGQEPNGLS